MAFFHNVIYSIDMFKKSVLMILLTILGHGAGVAGLYWAYSWFDTPMHFLGGLAAGVLALDIWHFAMRAPYGRHVRILRVLFVLGLVSLIGVLWELHEYLLDLRHYPAVLQPSIADTMKDLMMDLLGGGFAYVGIGSTYSKQI